jgi:hypothetical protein
MMHVLAEIIKLASNMIQMVGSKDVLVDLTRIQFFPVQGVSNFKSDLNKNSIMSSAGSRQF